MPDRVSCVYIISTWTWANPLLSITYRRTVTMKTMILCLRGLLLIARSITVSLSTISSNSLGLWREAERRLSSGSVAVRASIQSKWMSSKHLDPLEAMNTPTRGSTSSLSFVQFGPVHGIWFEWKFTTDSHVWGWPCDYLGWWEQWTSGCWLSPEWLLPGMHAWLIV